MKHWNIRARVEQLLAHIVHSSFYAKRQSIMPEQELVFSEEAVEYLCCGSLRRPWVRKYLSSLAVTGHEL
jgi:hypothetical protein